MLVMDDPEIEVEKTPGKKVARTSDMAECGYIAPCPTRHGALIFNATRDGAVTMTKNVGHLLDRSSVETGENHKLCGLKSCGKD